MESRNDLRISTSGCVFWPCAYYPPHFSILAPTQAPADNASPYTGVFLCQHAHSYLQYSPCCTIILAQQFENNSRTSWDWLSSHGHATSSGKFFFFQVFQITLTLLKASISLLVCNILVVVTSFYRFLCTEPALKPVGDPHSLPTPRSTIIARVPRSRSSIGTENNTNPQNGISFTGHDRSQGTGTNSDLSNISASSDYVVLTELFESDLAHSLPGDIEIIERSEKI